MDNRVYLLVKGIRWRIQSEPPSDVKPSGVTWELCGRHYSMGVYRPVELANGWTLLGVYDPTDNSQLEAMLAAAVRHEVGRAKQPQKLTDLERQLAKRLEGQTPDQNWEAFERFIVVVGSTNSANGPYDPREVREVVIDQLNRSTIRQRYVVYLRYGLGAQQPVASFGQIAEKLGSGSAATVREMHERVLARVRVTCRRSFKK